MFVVNLFELTNFLRGNSQYKYVLDIIDHFSKMLMSHLIKWGYSFNSSIRQRKKFVNYLLADFLEDNKIKNIRDRLYHPQSQRVVERVHITVRNSLIVPKENFHE